MRYELPPDSTVQLQHYRAEQHADAEHLLEPYTTRTVARLVQPANGVVVLYAVAWCRPGEQFNHRIGGAIATGRLAKRYATWQTMLWDPAPHIAGVGDVPSWVLASRDIRSVRSFLRLADPAR